MTLQRPRLRLPALHPKQHEIMEDDHRFKIVAAGRRFGKSRLGVSKCIRVASGDRWWRPEDRSPGRVWWVPPIYKQGQVAWRQLKRAGESIPGTVIRSVVGEIELPNGGTIGIRTGDSPDSLRSEGLDYVVLDEAAFLREEVWTEALRPALSDKRGGGLFISTPKGMNWFYDRYELADTLDDWKAWTFTTADNPYIHPDEIEAARAELGSIVFAQEYLAEFVEAGGTVFHPDTFRYWSEHSDYQYRIDGPVGPLLLDARGGIRFCTVDLAASLKESADYTVIMSFAWHEPYLLLLDVVRRRMEGPDIVPAVQAQMTKHDLGVAWIEKAGFQLSLIQEARRRGLPVKELTPDKDKYARALPLAARMEQSQVWMRKGAPWLTDLERELMAFPVGDYDDQVDAFAYGAEVALRYTFGKEPDLTGWSPALQRSSPNRPG